MKKKAYQVIDGVEVATSVSELEVGAIVAVHTGERIPADGVIVSGHATIDDAHITGRSVPEYRSTGSKVFAGTLVHDGAIHIKAEKVGKETYLARMLEMVEESLATRAPIMDQGDVLSARLTRLGIILSVGTLIVTQSIYRVLTVLLVMSCPAPQFLPLPQPSARPLPTQPGKISWSRAASILRRWENRMLSVLTRPAQSPARDLRLKAS